MKSMKGFRTLLLNISALLGAVVIGAVDVIPVEYLPIILAVQSVLNIYLRYQTTGPVGQKDEPPAG
jgi:hypothetical protein